MPQIVRELVVSTAHMPNWVARAMDERNNREMVMLPYDCVEFGYLVWVCRPEDSSDYPPELDAVMAMARKHGCTWIRFDCDAAIEEDLPKWEW
jgi:hypothetical protein